MLLSSLGISIANVGLPTLAQAFDASFREVQWIVLAYLLAITILVVGVGRYVFRDTALESVGLLAILGLLISIVGQLGDLMLSSIKRDLGLKDMGVTIPGHGGLLDRFDSVILAAPVVFHYVNYFVGVGADQAPRVLTGG